jgi:hypothetical protein
MGDTLKIQNFKILSTPFSPFPKISALQFSPFSFFFTKLLNKSAIRFVLWWIVLVEQN